MLCDIVMFLVAIGAAVMVPFSNMADFRHGFFVTLMNPEAVVFYMTVFPLFIDPATQQGAATFTTMGAVIYMYPDLWQSAGPGGKRRRQMSCAQPTFS